MTTMRVPDVLNVRAGEGLALLVRFKGEPERRVDLASWVADVAALRPLRDPAFLATVRVAYGGGGIAWGEVTGEDGEGPIDMSGELLWRLAGEQAGELMPLAVFRAWRERHGLSVPEAARTLGISPRMAAYYESGAWPIPKTVMLACEGVDARRAAA